MSSRNAKKKRKFVWGADGKRHPVPTPEPPSEPEPRTSLTSRPGPSSRVATPKTIKPGQKKGGKFVWGADGKRHRVPTPEPEPEPDPPEPEPEPELEELPEEEFDPETDEDRTDDYNQLKKMVCYFLWQYGGTFHPAESEYFNVDQLCYEMDLVMGRLTGFMRAEPPPESDDLIGIDEEAEPPPREPEQEPEDLMKMTPPYYPAEEDLLHFSYEEPEGGGWLQEEGRRQSWAQRTVTLRSPHHAPLTFDILMMPIGIQEFSGGITCGVAVSLHEEQEEELQQLEPEPMPDEEDSFLEGYDEAMGEDEDDEMLLTEWDLPVKSKRVSHPSPRASSPVGAAGGGDDSFLNFGEMDIGEGEEDWLM